MIGADKEIVAVIDRLARLYKSRNPQGFTSFEAACRRHRRDPKRVIHIRVEVGAFVAYAYSNGWSLVDWVGRPDRQILAAKVGPDGLITYAWDADAVRNHLVTAINCELVLDDLARIKGV